LAVEVTESVRTISWDGSLRDPAVLCLSLDTELRPWIGDVLYKLTKGAGDS